MDYSLPGSSDHGILQARVLEWGAIAFSQECHPNLHRMPDVEWGLDGVGPGLRFLLEEGTFRRIGKPLRVDQPQARRHAWEDKGGCLSAPPAPGPVPLYSADPAPLFEGRGPHNPISPSLPGPSYLSPLGLLSGMLARCPGCEPTLPCSAQPCRGCCRHSSLFPLFLPFSPVPAACSEWVSSTGPHPGIPGPSGEAAVVPWGHVGSTGPPSEIWGMLVAFSGPHVSFYCAVIGSPVGLSPPWD